MKVFALTYAPLVPSYIFKSICRVLNGITNKKIQLPYKLLQLHKKHPDTRCYQAEGVNEMQRQFLEKQGPHDLIDYNGVLLKNRSNMMQGICHFTSSLVHSGALITYCEFMKMIIVKLVPGSVVHYTHMQSFDDSCIILSVSRPKTARKQRILLWIMKSLLSAREKSMPMWCARSSVPKTAVGSFSAIFEFNSEWRVNNSLLRPLIKFILPALEPACSSSLISRTLSLFNTRSNCVKAGACFKLTSIIQFLQLLVHYGSFQSLFRQTD